MQESLYPIKQLTHEEALKVIETREPYGLFWEKTKSRYVGIDNSTGDAWVEEFFKKSKCIAWLKGE